MSNSEVEPIIGHGVIYRFLKSASDSDIHDLNRSQRSCAEDHLRKEHVNPIDSSSMYITVSGFHSNKICEDGKLIFKIPHFLKTYCFVVIDGHGGIFSRNIILHHFAQLLFKRLDFVISSRY